MNTTNVAKINGVSLQVVAGEREQLVAVKPVCEILGVDFSAQRAKLKEHPIYGPTMVLSTTVGGDGKEREMACIPLQFFPGWLFSINPDNVKEEAREQLIKYQLECNKVLFDYFFGRAEFAQKKEQEFSRQMEIVTTAKKNFRDAKLVLNEAEMKLRQINALTFEDYVAGNRQLSIPGF